MFRWARNKIKLERVNSGLVSAFSKIKSDLQSQKKYLDDIYENHHALKNNTHLNHKRMADWVRHFDKSIKTLESDVNSLEKHISEKFDALAESSLQLFKEAYAKNIKDSSAIKKEILKELEVMMNAQTGGVKNHIVESKTIASRGESSSFDALSNPEKWLVGVLFNSENPLSYSQIAEKTGKTVNTVRVYMNQLKFKGFIDESSLPNGVKLFGLRHKAKVKKLYNL